MSSIPFMPRSFLTPHSLLNSLTTFSPSPSRLSALYLFFEIIFLTNLITLILTVYPSHQPFLFFNSSTLTTSILSSPTLISRWKRLWRRAEGASRKREGRPHHCPGGPGEYSLRLRYLHQTSKGRGGENLRGPSSSYHALSCLVLSYLAESCESSLFRDSFFFLSLLCILSMIWHGKINPIIQLTLHTVKLNNLIIPLFLSHSSPHLNLSFSFSKDHFTFLLHPFSFHRWSPLYPTILQLDLHLVSLGQAWVGGIWLLLIVMCHSCGIKSPSSESSPCKSCSTISIRP